MKENTLSTKKKKEKKKNGEEKKKRKHALDQGSKFKKIKKKGRKWKMQIRIKHLAYFLDIFNMVELTNDRKSYKWLKVN